MMETCENCGMPIGKLETPQVWKDHIVCIACYHKLSIGGGLNSGSYSSDDIRCPMCRLKCPLGSDKCSVCGHENPCDFVNAAYLGALETVTDLLRAGIEVNLRTEYGHTALIMAPGSWYDAIHKIGDNLSNPPPKTEDRVKMVRVLLEAGADPNAKDEHGYTALHSAARMGLREAIILLIKHGAEVNAKDFGGDTALSIAQRNGHKAAAIILRQNGGKKGTWWGT
jgi:ankyrin repeat protein